MIVCRAASHSTNVCCWTLFIEHDADLLTESPRPCTFFYLSLCKQGDRCTYGHDYFLTADNYAELRANAKKSPCPSVNMSTSWYGGLVMVDLNPSYI